jgi:competence protein ComEC
MTPSTHSLVLVLCILFGCTAASLPTAHFFTPLLCFLTFAVAALILLFHQRNVPAFLALFLLGFSYTGWWRFRHTPPVFDSYPAICTGVVAEPPDIRPNRQLITLLPDVSPDCARFAQSHSRILLFFDRYPAYQFGDRLKVKGSIDPPQPIEDFNYPLYLERYEIAGVIRRPQATLIEQNKGSPIFGWLYSFRYGTEHAIAGNLPEPEAGFLSGIILGSKRSVPEDVQAALRATGTSHIIAISGANITILLTILLGILPLYKRHHQALLATIISLFMIFLTGASASVIRGGVVACLSLWLKAGERRAWPTPLLVVSIFLMVIGNPLLMVADVGFQLSFAAFAGLLYLSEPLSLYCARLPFLSRLPSTMQASLVETTAATLGTTLISLAQFQQVSLLGLIVNPLILWLLPFTTAVGLILILCALVGVHLPLLNLITWLPLHTILSIITWFGARPIGMIQSTFPRWIIITLFASLIVWRQFRESRVFLTYKPT